MHIVINPDLYLHLQYNILNVINDLKQKNFIKIYTLNIYELLTTIAIDHWSF